VRDPFDPEFVIVELKSGDELRGELLELVPGDHVTIDAGAGRHIRIAKKTIKWVQRRVDPKRMREPRPAPAGGSAPAGRDTPSAAAPGHQAQARVPARAKAAPEPDASAAGVPTTSNDELARYSFAAGRDAYAKGDYREATAHFETAYRLSARVDLLYNMGLAADADEQRERAVRAYEAFLRARPDSDLRGVIRARIRELTQAVPAHAPTVETVAR
jgi:tetratricopeptide (TPR) repeat protein